MSKHLGETIIPEQLNAKAKPLRALCAMQRSDVAEAMRKDRNKSPPEDSAGRDPSRPTVTGFDGESTYREKNIFGRDLTRSLPPSFAQNQGQSSPSSSSQVPPGAHERCLERSSAKLTSRATPVVENPI